MLDNSPATQKILTFSLAKEIYAIDVDHVVQIIALPPITIIPNSPPNIKGVINLRGKIIPVLELSKKFAINTPADSQRQSLLITKTCGGDDNNYIGLLVDKVLEVENIQENQIGPLPDFGVIIDNKYVKGIAQINEQLIIVLEIEKIFSDKLTKK